MTGDEGLERPLSVRVAEGPGALVDAGEVRAMAVGVIQSGGHAVFGLGRFGRKGEPERVPDGRTVFEIGSISKVFTGVLLGEMVARGEARLDEPVVDLLPDRPITLELLATHASGLPRLPSNLGFRPLDPYSGYDAAKLLDFLGKHELRRDPGEATEYSNLGAGLLGHALALRAGKASYEELLVERICDPLGMADTRVALRPDMSERLCPGFSELGLPAGNWDLAVLAGAGGIRSTVDDMLKLARFCLSPDGSPLGLGVRSSLEPRRGWSDGDARVGLHWLLLPGGVAFHNGQTGGHHSWLAISQGRGTALAMLSNRAIGKAEGPCRALFDGLASARG
jgi:CubicO group peptidase (beta-lactamase class C family)